jgi:hypothetical protein
MSITDLAHLLETERDSLRTECESLRLTKQMHEQELDSLSRQNTTLQSERDYYMRFNAELMTHLSNAGSILVKAVSDAKVAGFRPNGAVPKAEKLLPEADLPGFLAQGPKEGEPVQ